MVRPLFEKGLSRAGEVLWKYSGNKCVRNQVADFFKSNQYVQIALQIAAAATGQSGAARLPVRHMTEPQPSAISP